jgi:hypothetical protein
MRQVLTDFEVYVVGKLAHWKSLSLDQSFEPPQDCPELLWMVHEIDCDREGSQSDDPIPHGQTRARVHLSPTHIMRWVFSVSIIIDTRRRSHPYVVNKWQTPELP